MREKIFKTSVSAVIGIFCAVTLLLFAAIFLGSVKTNEELLTSVWSLPKGLCLDNFKKILIEDHFGTYILNSLIVLICSLTLTLLFATTVSYGIEKFQVRGRNFLKVYFIIGIMFPIQLGIVNLYQLVKTLHLTNSLWGVILVYASSLSMAVLVLTGYLKSIPDSIMEAARIDGAGEFTIFSRIVLPLLKPALGALIPMLSVNYWNDFFVPLVFLTEDAKKTLPIAIMRYSLGEHTDYSKMSILFSVITISILPIMVIYLIFSKHIIGGIVAGAEKG